MGIFSQDTELIHLMNKRDNMLDECVSSSVNGDFPKLRNQLDRSKDIRKRFRETSHSCPDSDKLIILASQFIETCDIFERLLHEELVRKEMGIDVQKNKRITTRS